MGKKENFKRKGGDLFVLEVGLCVFWMFILVVF